jgi:hypothetical protein
MDFIGRGSGLDPRPLLDAEIRKRNLTVQNYPSGHMIYLDEKSRTAMKTDLAAFYDRAVEGVSIAQSYSWLPPRVDGLPRRHGLWVYTGIAAGTGEIRPEGNFRAPARTVPDRLSGPRESL